MHLDSTVPFLSCCAAQYIRRSLRDLVHRTLSALKASSTENELGPIVARVSIAMSALEICGVMQVAARALAQCFNLGFRGRVPRMLLNRRGNASWCPEDPGRRRLSLP